MSKRSDPDPTCPKKLSYFDRIRIKNTSSDPFIIPLSSLVIHLSSLTSY